MLTHAFETWQVLGVCFHTDARNQRFAHLRSNASAVSSRIPEPSDGR